MYGNFRGAGDGVMTDVQLLRKARLLPVQLQLRIERIKFAARLFGEAPEELRRLAADENCNVPGTWHGILAQDLEQTALIMHKELGVMPPYSCKPEEWHKLWVDCWSKDLLNGCRSLIGHRKRRWSTCALDLRPGWCAHVHGLWQTVRIKLWIGRTYG